MENKKPVIVFDFDKTLTLHDTIAGYYLSCNKNFSLIWKVPYFFIFVFLHVFKQISNDELKSNGVEIFLKGKTKKELNEAGEKYAKKIKFNKIYETEFLKKNPNAIIASASFYEYLQFLFSEDQLLASSLIYNELDLVVGLKTNMYGYNKVEALRERKINKIDVFYTDSFSDKPLMEIADITFLIYKNSVTKIE